MVEIVKISTQSSLSGGHSIEIEIRKFKDVDCEGATIINGFPSETLIGAVIANYLIGTLKLDQISALDSKDFPPLSMIYDAKPKFPARIYAAPEYKVVTFLSEFTPSIGLARALANTILTWAHEHRCERIIALEGTMRPHLTQTKEEALEVYGIGCTDNARAMLKKSDIKQLQTGIVSGLSGILLNEGRWSNFDVIVLFFDIGGDVPVPRVVAKGIITLCQLLPHLKLDIQPLLDEAAKIEARVKKMREHVPKPATLSEGGLMYYA